MQTNVPRLRWPGRFTNGCKKNDSRMVRWMDSGFHAGILLSGAKLVEVVTIPDYQLRLIRRGRAHYVLEREVHEIVAVDGAEANLSQPLLHYNYTSWDQFHAKQRFYSTYEARILASRGIYPRPHNFALQPLREFWRRFVTLNGWRDGWHGLRLAFLLAWYYGLMPYWWLATGDY